MALSAQEKEAQKLIITEIEKALKMEAEFYAKWCKEHLTEAVPMGIVKQAQSIILRNMKKGAGIE